MVSLFGNYDALRFPTWRREPFGFTVSEAAGSGCFPIMTAGIGASEWFVDRVDSLKIAGTPSALSHAMHENYMPQSTRERIRRNTLETARRYLSFDRWFAALETAVRGATDNAIRRPSTAHIRAIEASFLLESGS
jgi:glycosyltransferase involved in cell wall biosynthesis